MFRGDAVFYIEREDIGYTLLYIETRFCKIPEKEEEKNSFRWGKYGDGWERVLYCLSLHGCEKV